MLTSQEPSTVGKIITSSFAEEETEVQIFI